MSFEEQLAEGFSETVEEAQDNSGHWAASVTLEDGSEISVAVDMSELIESLGKIVDQCDNFLSFRDNHHMPAPMKIGALAHGLKDVRQAVFEVYTSLGGENHWEGRDG